MREAEGLREDVQFSQDRHEAGCLEIQCPISVVIYTFHLAVSILFWKGKLEVVAWSHAYTVLPWCPPLNWIINFIFERVINYFTWFDAQYLSLL